MAQVADRLAVAVGTQWENEAAVRRLNDPWPLPVSWTAADPSLTDAWDSLAKLAISGVGWPPPPPWGTWAVGPDDLAGERGELVDVLARVPTGRLVVLGEPGAGKTMLMIRLVLDLLARRDAGRPVPFLASVASWDPSEQDLRNWLAAQLVIDHPALASRPPEDMTGPNQAEALLASGLILPILDGLDEIPEQVRGPAISRINDALRPSEQLVVTCRAQQYRDAVRPQGDLEVTLRAAAAVQMRPLHADAVRDYLRGDAAGPAAKARWEPVLAVLGTEAPVGQALSTPLMVALARSIYNPRPGELTGALRDPAELCRPEVADRKEVESLLFDAFIPAAYRHDPAGNWKAQDAERWFVFLARHLEHTIGGPDLAWWQLRRAVPRIIFGLATVLGLALLLAAGWVLLPSDLRTVAGFVSGLRSGLTFGLGFGLGTVLTAGLGLGPGKSNLRTPSRGIRINAGALRFGLEYGLGSGVIIGLLFLLTGRFVAALGICLGLGLGSGYLAGLANGLTAAPGDLAAAASPRAVLLRDQRATLLLILAGGLAIGLAVGFAAWLRSGPAAGIGLGLAAGLAAGLLISASQTVWPSYVLTVGWLASHRCLPWSLMSFLAYAHERGVLRQAGAVYQFRHIDLQHRLATRGRTANGPLRQATERRDPRMPALAINAAGQPWEATGLTSCWPC